MNLGWWFKVEKGTIIFQRDEFDNYYRSVLNGGKYVDLIVERTLIHPTIIFNGISKKKRE